METRWIKIFTIEKKCTVELGKKYRGKTNGNSSYDHAHENTKNRKKEEMVAWRNVKCTERKKTQEI